jgi:hypothetical protein
MMEPLAGSPSLLNDSQYLLGLDWFADQPVTKVGTPQEESAAWFNPVEEPDLSLNLPSARTAPVDTASQGLTQRDLDEMALFQMMSEQLLTGNDYFDQLVRNDPYLQER